MLKRCLDPCHPVNRCDAGSAQAHRLRPALGPSRDLSERGWDSGPVTEAGLLPSVPKQGLEASDGGFVFTFECF